MQSLRQQQVGEYLAAHDYLRVEDRRHALADHRAGRFVHPDRLGLRHLFDGEEDAHECG